MKKIYTLLMAFAIISSLSSCLKDDSEEEPQVTEESKVQVVSSSEYGQIITASGIKLEIIPGVVPPNGNNEEGTVTFSIESPVQRPGILTGGAEFVGQGVRFGPENFNFAWPLNMSLPYTNYSQPERLSVVYYHPIEEEWMMIPHTTVNSNDNTISFCGLSLGIYSLAVFPLSAKDDCDGCSGGIAFDASVLAHSPSAGTVVSHAFSIVNAYDYRYPSQANYLGQPPSGAVAMTTAAHEQLSFIVPQATYEVMFIRTLIPNGSFSNTAYAQTYTKSVTVVVDEYIHNYQHPFQEGWKWITLPEGGEWVDGYPNTIWPAPTVTYGTGDFQATLTWVNNQYHSSDIDLHLYGPNEMHVYYSNSTSNDGVFQLDRDWLTEAGNAVENIYSIAAINSGTYTVNVKLYSGSPSSFNVRIINGGSVESYSGSLDPDNDEVQVYTFTK